MMYGNGMMNGWGVMGPMGWIFMLLFWIFAIFGLVCAVRFLVGRGNPGGGHGAPETPLEILKRRYAKGEISKEEFQGAKKDLE